MTKHERLCRAELHAKARVFVRDLLLNGGVTLHQIGELDHTINAVCLALSEIAHEKDKLARTRAARVGSEPA